MAINEENLKDENLEETVAEESEAEAKEAEDAQETETAEAAETEAKDAQESEEDSKKKKRKEKKKDKKDAQIEELTDRVKRQMAEFDNFRRRTEKEKSQMFETGAKSIIEKILPIVDNFERGVAALSEEDLGSPVGQGMNLIYKQLLSTLDEMGVTAIEAEGKEFDSDLHNAVMHEENDELGENITLTA